MGKPLNEMIRSTCLAAAWICFGTSVADAVSADWLDKVTYRYVEFVLRPKTWDEELWRSTGNGGYVFRFRLDLEGDGETEHFLSSSKSMEKTFGSWQMLSARGEKGKVRLHLGGFVLVRKEDGAHLPYGFDVDAMTATWTDQTVGRAGVQISDAQGTPDELSKLRRRWKAEGQFVQPEIEVILISDYVRGDREWRRINFSQPGYQFRADWRISLPGDEEKLDDPSLTPELALKLLRKRPEKDLISPPAGRPEKKSLPRGGGEESLPVARLEETSKSPAPVYALALALGSLIAGLIVWLRARGSRA